VGAIVIVERNLKIFITRNHGGTLGSEKGFHPVHAAILRISGPKSALNHARAIRVSSAGGGSPLNLRPDVPQGLRHVLAGQVQ